MPGKPSPACEIHWARLSSLRPEHGRLLDRHERDRAQAYVRGDDRARFTLAAVLLRALMSRRLGVAPERATVDRTCPRCGEMHGRPRLPGSGMEASVSHSGDFVAVATTDQGPVGVDIERVRPIDVQGLGRDALTPEELEATTDFAEFYAVWTRKESVLKAFGVGLQMPMTEVHVTPASQPPRLLAYADRKTPAARMTDAAPADGYAGAATVLTSAPVRFQIADADQLVADL